MNEVIWQYSTVHKSACKVIEEQRQRTVPGGLVFPAWISGRLVFRFELEKNKLKAYHGIKSELERRAEDGSRVNLGSSNE